MYEDPYSITTSTKQVIEEAEKNEERQENATFYQPDEKDDFFDDLYSDFSIHRVEAIRAINSDGAGRGAITEILVTNYEVSG